MGEQASLFSGYKPETDRIIYEYFFLISPDEAIKEKVTDLKKRLDKEIGIDKKDLHSIPHITLLKKRSISDKLDLSPFAEALSTAPAFEVPICGLGTFTQYNAKRTLFLKIEQETIIDCIYNDFKRIDFSPHITIARNIDKDALRNIADISSYELQGEFYCDRITVLKRAIHPKEEHVSFYELYDELHLLKSTNPFFG